MNSPRLTGLEFSWFTKCQMLASSYDRRWDTQLESETRTLVESVAADARTSFTGPQSMRRVAERIDLVVQEMEKEKDRYSSADEAKHDTIRLSKALKYVSSKLALVSFTVEDWRRDPYLFSKELVPLSI